jgi:MFS family permease
VLRSAGLRPVPLKTQVPIYAAGFFSNSLADVASVVLPLWLASIGVSTGMIGIVVGSRHLLPFLLAIHGGALMDRVGVRQLMIGCALVSAVAMPLFPVFGWLPAVIVLQMLNGYGASMGWIGAQTCFGRLLSGSATYAGRFSFSLRLGSFSGPPIAGLAWDHVGVWGAFAVLSVWAAGIAVAALFVTGEADGPAEERRKLRWSDTLPRLADYRDAVDMAREPAMQTVLLITIMRIAASSVQDSFYPVYLHSIGLPATQIGLLITCSSALGAVSALWVGYATRYMSPLWVLIWTTFGSIFFVSITPALAGFWALAVAAALRGLCMGLSQPLMLSILADAAGRGALARGAALRTTANRVASAATPVCMGAVASVVGLAGSFHIIGAILTGVMIAISIRVVRRPEIDAGAREG